MAFCDFFDGAQPDEASTTHDGDVQSWSALFIRALLRFTNSFRTPILGCTPAALGDRARRCREAIVLP